MPNSWGSSRTPSPQRGRGVRDKPKECLRRRPVPSIIKRTNQSRAQSLSGSLSAAGRREKLWDNGISLNILWIFWLVVCRTTTNQKIRRIFKEIPLSQSQSLSRWPTADKKSPKTLGWIFKRSLGWTRSPSPGASNSHVFVQWRFHNLGYFWIYKSLLWKLVFPMTSTSRIRNFKNEMSAKLFPTWMNFGALIPFPPVRIQSIKSFSYSKPVFPQYIVF